MQFSDERGEGIAELPKLALSLASCCSAFPKYAWARRSDKTKNISSALLKLDGEAWVASRVWKGLPDSASPRLRCQHAEES